MQAVQKFRKECKRLKSHYVCEIRAPEIRFVLQMRGLYQIPYQDFLLENWS